MYNYTNMHVCPGFQVSSWSARRPSKIIQFVYLLFLAILYVLVQFYTQVILEGNISFNDIKMLPNQ